jgi:hypothetical protein
MLVLGVELPVLTAAVVLLVELIAVVLLLVEWLALTATAE